MNYQNKSNEELISELLLVRQELNSLKMQAKQESHGHNQAETGILPEQERPNFMKESSFYGFWDWDIPSGRVYFSPKWKAMLGYAGSEIENKLEAWSERVHPQDMDTVLLALNRHLRGETDSYRSEHRMLCKDGSFKWIHGEGKVVEKDGQGNPLRAVGTHTDITHYKKTESALHERMKELNCHNRISEVMSDPHLSMEDVIEKTLRLIPDAWQFPEKTHSSVQVRGSEYRTPGFLRSENSLTEEIRANNSIIGRIEVCYSEDNHPGESLLVFLPEEASLLFSIAERLGNYIHRNENEKALSENEQKYRELVENISDVIYKIDAGGIITYISSAIEKIIGYPAEKIIGKSFAPFVGINSEFLTQRLKELSLKNELDKEYKIVSRTGETRWIRLATKAVFKDGKLTGSTLPKIKQGEDTETQK
jgi:PAS domain S-box-containing protein